MARISYDDQTAAAYKAVREVPQDGLGAWREAVRRHLRPSPRLTVVDIGAGTGAFATAFSDWFDLAILAVEQERTRTGTAGPWCHVTGRGPRGLRPGRGSGPARWPDPRLPG